MFALRQIVQDPTTVSEVISAVKDLAPNVLGVTATRIAACKLSAQFKTWLENNKKEVDENEKDSNGEPTPGDRVASSLPKVTKLNLTVELEQVIVGDVYMCFFPGICSLRIANIVPSISSSPGRKNCPAWLKIDYAAIVDVPW
ncbi:unnamed protein product [Didymodactylos carnosus]|uniref:Uncharacterized protein n=1 Tax=Didymodactylos carnosus TaxID=1234261 RepID=A0A814K7C0_9BILA|nr:unnamed protein product [Didymodactylos carnosus]CAF1045516.1 unnamed protein product [Didymodactylos carnosus]CAF3590100.1 unnamed protein product [Didymodactylos carnosus]CAF3815446.1 unnamed protein product [Didymodactylos carnosus]